MIVYRIKFNRIFEIRQEPDNYVLQQDEYSNPTHFVRPLYTGSDVIENATQADIDDDNEHYAQRDAEELQGKREKHGIQFFRKVAVKVKRAYDDGNIDQTQYKNIRTSLQTVLQPLRYGDWDVAQDNINAISRPSGQMGVLYDFLKNKIDTYVSANY
jgi:hypothetical protein